LKIAFVIQRYGEEIVGVPNTLPDWYRENGTIPHEIEILTTCGGRLSFLEK
jgi:hypothetical protein